VIEMMEDVKEVCKKMLTITLRAIQLNYKVIIHTQVRMVIANITHRKE
jgi:hypothetical protein